ncbi:hypothetical protein RQP46_008865 [Phenoliferia psychrophenolica]
MTTASSLLTRLDVSLRTPTGKLALVALASTLLTTASILSAQAVRRRTRRIHLRDEIEDLVHHEEEDGEEDMIDFTRQNGGPATRKSKSSKGRAGEGKKRKPTSEVIIREALARHQIFFGEEGLAKIRNSFVVVVGLGGVGSATAVMLVRSGVRKIRLIDFDQVSLSSLNRHATATLAQVGTPKVTSCADAFEAIAPWVEVDPRIELFGKDTADELLGGNPDYVIDCIDNIESKVDLLAYCHSHKIPVFSSLGAGAKSDASMIQIRKLLGVLSGIPVVYSTEKPRADIGLLPLPEEEFQKGKVDELSAIANFRVRILPVLGPLPAMFGNAAAAYVLQQLAGFPSEPLPVKNRLKAAAAMLRGLAATEDRLSGPRKLPIGEDDALYVFEEIHRARSVAPPFKVVSRPTLLRWKKAGPIALENLVVFEKEEGERHMEHCLLGDEDPEVYWGEEVTALVNKRIAEERRLRPYRT